MVPYYDHDGITIYHGDCREILPSLPVCDLVVTDPPYAVSVAGAARVGMAGKGIRRLDFFAGDDDWGAMMRLVREAVGLACDRLSAIGSLYAWCGHRQLGSLVEDMEARGMSTRFLVWAKLCPPPPPPGSGWPSGAELCLYAYPAGRTWTMRDHPARSNVITADSFRHGQPGKVDHPTQKPFCVIAPLISASSLPGQTVIDPFMGSGTTLRAAKDIGRNAIGIEIEERYCEIAAKRLAQETLFGIGVDHV